ncbi:hypothetical protein [Streptomyces sp. NPDC004286]|uniref:hypothetical protein n=1 Tax=Streptomyces sp. NPDC004286 TaxID=3364696 RepID=UPI0036BA8A73
MAEIKRGGRVRVERRPSRTLAAVARPTDVYGNSPWPDVWEGRVLQVVREEGELEAIEVLGKRESTGEVRRITFNVAANRFFVTTVTPVEGP